jgi:uncharacterized protein (DUF305 family)
MSLRSTVAFAVLLAVPAFALAQMPGMNMGGAMMGPMLPPGEQTEATTAFMAAHDAMITNMHVQLTGNPDRDFALLMIPHHQAAIDMARVELQYGTDPALRQMAEEIIAAQEAEIAILEAWLSANP